MHLGNRCTIKKKKKIFCLFIVYYIYVCSFYINVYFNLCNVLIVLKTLK